MKGEVYEIEAQEVNIEKGGKGRKLQEFEVPFVYL